MLILPLKGMHDFDLHTALATWLDLGDQHTSFGASHSSGELKIVIPKPQFTSQQCRKELVRLHGLRKCLADTITKPTAHKAALEDDGLRDVQEYHAALLEFEKRGFPTTDDESNHLALTYRGAFAPQQETHHTLVWDRACTMFNTVALLTQDLEVKEKQAAEADSDPTALKTCIGHCQTASSMLHILADLAASEDFVTCDLSPPLLQFWEDVLTAQAQAYIYQLASPRNQHGILSALAASAHQLFNQALSKAQNPRLQSEVPRLSDEWGAYCKAHSMMSAAKAEYHQAVLQRQEQQWGVELARLRQCLLKLEQLDAFLNSANDLHAGVLLRVTRECQTYLPFVQDRYRQGQDDNTNVYGDEVPTTLPDIGPKQLAKTEMGLPAAMVTPQVPLFTSL